jgi:uncharacterized protein
LNKELLTQEEFVLNTEQIPSKFINELENAMYIQRMKVNKPNALLYIMLDTSGSMGIWEKYIVRCVYFWTKHLLSKKYNTVKPLFIYHHTEAHFTEDENAFFRRGESGGTIASSPLRLARTDIFANGYKDHDIYIIHGSDGDNLTSDNRRYFEHVKYLISISKRFLYLEVNQYNRHSTLLSGKKIHEADYMPYTVVRRREHVFDALDNIFVPLGISDSNIGNIHRLSKEW